MKMATNMKVYGKITPEQQMVHTNIQMAMSIQGNGEMILEMAKAN